MADYVIPITYVVNASAVLPSAGLEPLKLSTILLLTNDEQVTPIEDDYIIARTSTAVAQAFGTESTTFKMANAIFAQNPNILANDGYVIVANYLTDTVITPATAGTFTTADLTSKLAAIKLVSNGDLTVVIDGDNVGLTGVDCTSVETIEDLATLLDGLLEDCDVTVDENALVFTSKTTGVASTVNIIATADGEGTDLYGTAYLDGANGTEVDGQAEVRGAEPTSQAITRIASQIYFEGILTTKTLDGAEAINASAVVQGMKNRIFFLPSNDTNDIYTGGLFTQLQSNFYTKCLLYTKGELEAKLFAAAYASRLLSVNYSGSNTTITMNLKDLAGIVADTNISEAILNTCASIGVDCYPSIEGLAKVISNKNEYYIDQVANMIWLVNSVQTNVFNTLATTRTKIPQTEQGMDFIVNACRQVCTQAVRNGYVAAGRWNSSDTFGVFEDFHRNIEEFGYYVYHIPVAEQLQSEREQRKAPMVQIACKEAGAIHSANIMIYIEP